MKDHFPSLIVAFPLLMAFLTYMVGLFWRRCSYYFTFATAAIGVGMNIYLLIHLIKEKRDIRYFLGGWEPPWGIEYLIDYLNAPILTATSIIFLLLVTLTREGVRKEISEEKINVFYSLLLLQYTGLQGVTVTGDAFNLYVLLEIMSFSAYGIIGLGKKGAEFFAFRYMIMGTIGAWFYLLGVGHLYILTGSLNMLDLSRILPQLGYSKAVISGTIFIIIGILIKMAFFPFHTWMPDAYSYSPSSVSTFLAPLSTKVAAYVLLRFFFLIFTPLYGLKLIPIFHFLGFFAAVGIIFGSIMAILLKEVRRSLCYIVLSEICYIPIALSAANHYGFKGAILHIINDMFMVSCLFSVYSLLYSKTEISSTSEWKGITKTHPYTMATFVICALAIIGVPPLCGFFSKWYILLGLIAAKKWIFSSVIIGAALLNVIYFFKLIEVSYFVGERGHTSVYDATEKERMISLENVSLYVLTFFLLFLGIKSNYIVEGIISNSLPEFFR